MLEAIVRLLTRLAGDGVMGHALEDGSRHDFLVCVHRELHRLALSHNGNGELLKLLCATPEDLAALPFQEFVRLCQELHATPEGVCLRAHVEQLGADTVSSKSTRVGFARVLGTIQQLQNGDKHSML
ncbi:MAG: hypothetical protein G01um1014106_152 [Parcubacteria group bacterium Gr01-1014_106]|nr:MAG: hypothetical protein G01um1014106_152 [Parcubacteria group bacterium Gr01-1014_106]